MSRKDCVEKNGFLADGVFYTDNKAIFDIDINHLMAPFKRSKTVLCEIRNCMKCEWNYVVDNTYYYLLAIPHYYISNAFYFQQLSGHVETVQILHIAIFMFLLFSWLIIHLFMCMISDCDWVMFDRL